MAGNPHAPVLIASTYSIFNVNNLVRGLGVVVPMAIALYGLFTLCKKEQDDEDDVIVTNKTTNKMK